MSDASITPSSLASMRLPFNNFSSRFFWITFSSIELASIKSLETSTKFCFSLSVFGLSEIPVSVFTDTIWSILYKVFNTPSDEIFIIPTLPKLSLPKPTSLLSIVNLVPLISKVISGSSIIIEPSIFLAIFPDSIITDPFLTSPKKIFLKPVILKSVTLNDDNFFIITVELSLYCTIAVDNSFVKIWSCRNISSYKSNNLFSPSTFIA